MRPFCHLGLLLCCLATVVYTGEVTSPPDIIRGPKHQTPFKEGEQVKIKCVATGDPAPQYRWTRNDVALVVDGVKIKQEANAGTLVLPEPTEDDAGWYQCLAENSYGVAVSIKTELKPAFQDPFKTVKSTQNHRVSVGEQLTLNCDVPEGYPSPRVFWSLAESDEFEIEEDKRVTTDYEGNLHFANIIEWDHQGDSTYVCTVHNRVLRTFVQGMDATIDPQGTTPIPYKKPSNTWHSKYRVRAMRGENVKMKCIFAGYPTPDVTWRRLDGPMPSNAKMGSFGMELIIARVQFEDKGKYRCEATNADPQNPSQTNTLKSEEDFVLTVESMPFWIEKPTSVGIPEEEDHTFFCKAGGIPAPSVEWYMNGRPISTLPDDSRMLVGRNEIKFLNLTKTDSKVLQCNATNENGYIFANAFLNVLAEAPSFTDPPQEAKAAIGQTILLKCRVFGAPKPVIVWKRDNIVVVGDRYRTTEKGDLEITDVQNDDEATYTCTATNKFGAIDGKGTLTVREPTKITHFSTDPTDLTLVAGAKVEFKCEAVTDEQEAANLTIEWKKDGEYIAYAAERRMAKNTVDNSLIISNVQTEDTATYTCVASNKLDEATREESIIVQDKPDPPTEIKMSSCGSRSAELSWKAGASNNAQITEYLVEYNTSYDRDRWIVEEDNKVPGTENSARIDLSPYANYTFRVRASNAIGLSDPSEHTGTVCTTPPARPDVNPKNVCIKNTSPTKLIITWEPMRQLSQNGPEFRYVLSYTPDRADGESTEVTITDSSIGEYEVDNTPTYAAYRIWVKALNKMGEAIVPPLEITGYSGEDSPDVIPGNFALEGEAEAEEAVFTWDAIDPKPETVRGFFRGYKVLFWKADDPDNKRDTMIIKKESDPCTGGPKGGRFVRQAESTERHHVKNLWPYSDIVATVMVINNGYSGVPSNEVTFTTPEGVPGAVGMMKIINVGSHHMQVLWTPPAEPNGKLLGYEVRATSIGGTPHSETVRVENPLQLTVKIKNLNPDTNYHVFVYGRTIVGLGTEMMDEARTEPDGPPTAPDLTVKGLNDDSINVTWSTQNGNPGAIFLVEYRPVGEEEWDQTEEEEHATWENITGLITGGTYEVRVVAISGNRKEPQRTPSVIKTVVVGGALDTTIVTVETTTPNATQEFLVETLPPFIANTTSAAPNTTTATLLITNIPIGPVGNDSEANESLPIAPVGPATSLPVVGEQRQDIATAGWFIGMMVAIAILLLILIIICFIKRNRGGKYPVHEKEKLHGRDPEKEDEEAGFGEYTKTPPEPGLDKSEEPDYKKSAGSIESEDKPLESDTDSMAEYDETDPSKFNEDGSFIGQYGGKKKSDDRQDQDATSPSALTTFV